MISSVSDKVIILNAFEPFATGARVDCSHPLYLGTRKKKRAKRARSTLGWRWGLRAKRARKKSSVLRWRSVLSRFYPRV